MKLAEKRLNLYVENELTVKVFLTNGVQLNGIITDFDNDILVLEKDNSCQDVTRANIASIMPPKNGNV